MLRFNFYICSHGPNGSQKVLSCASLTLFIGFGTHAMVMFYLGTNKTEASNGIISLVEM